MVILNLPMRVFIFPLFILLLLNTAGSSDALPSKSPPKRVLLISVDTLRPDYLGCYGQKRLRTPQIDSLAQAGVTFDQAVSHVPLTLPSHISMLAGLYPTHHGVHDNSGFYLDPKLVTLAEIFQKEGFATAAFIAGFPLDSRFGMDQGFQIYHDALPMRLVNNDLALPELPASTVTDAALDWLAKIKKDQWFLFIHFYDPHHPYFPPEEYRKKYPRNFYAGEISYVDDQIGRLLQYLKDRNLLSSTLIVFTSDHGESLGAHGERSHGVFVYDTTMRVPLILTGPGIPSNKRVSTLARLIDVAPTVMDLMKIRNSVQMDGASLVKSWTSEQAAPRKQVSYFESLAAQMNRNWAPVRGFYLLPNKYIDLPIPELYQLDIDPEEKKNLCESDAKLCADYRDQYQQFAKSIGVSGVKAQEVDPEVAEQLEALGYVTSSQKVVAKKSYGKEDDPKTLIALDNMINEAFGLHHEGQDEKAIQMLETALQKRNDLKLAYLNLAYFYEGTGLLEKAASTLKRAIANGIQDSQIYSKLGFYLLQLGRSDEAVSHVQKSIQLNPKDLESYNYLGMVYTEQAKYDEAQKAFDKALELDRTVSVTYNNYAVLHLKRKDLSKALLSYQSAIEYDPQMVAAFNGMGVVYAMMNRQQDAINNWKKALDLDPKQLDALLNIGYAYLKQDRRGEASAAFQQFLAKASPHRYSQDIEKVKKTLEELQETSN